MHEREASIRALFVFSIGKLDGGAAHVWLNELDGLRARGVEPYVVIPRDSDGTMTAALEARDIPYSIIFSTWWVTSDPHPHSTKRRLRRKFATAVNRRAERAIEVLIARENIDLVYICDGVITTGIFAAGRAKVPAVWHFHEFIRGGEGGISFIDSDTAVSALLGSADAIITVTDALAEDLRHRFPIPRSLVRTVYNGIEPAAVADKGAVLEGDEVVFTLAGRIDSNKCPLEALEAFLIVATSHPEARLHFVGSGDAELLAQLQRRAAQLPQGAYVDFQGQRDDMPQVWAETDVALNCSRSEGCSMSIAESMSSGCLVLCSTAESNVELMREPLPNSGMPCGRHGLLYERGRIDALADQMEWVLTHHLEARAIAHTGKCFARATFDLDRQMDAVRSLFDEVLS